ncbi:MAG: hypothetical protein O2930_12740 [Acidobacteria bacterium]|nr:hypothetical protein [Acidobacteriota bacterium]
MARTGSVIGGLAAGALVALVGHGVLTAQVAAPAAPALEAVLYDAANSLGMLRTVEERDSITSQEAWAQGTMNVNGQTVRVTDYRLSLNYYVTGMRVDIKYTDAAGNAQRQIEVVAGELAWNETEPGLGATPAPGAERERLVQYWTNPIGVVKAAVLAGDAAEVAREGDNIVLTFPLPAPVDDVTMKATLRRDNGLFVYWASEPAAQARIRNRTLPMYPLMEGLVGTYITRVETQSGDTVTETTYAEYGDWNVDDNKADVMWPRRIVQTRGGVTLLDLRVTLTNTYNPYVVMRVPDALRN